MFVKNQRLHSHSKSAISARLKQQGSSNFLRDFVFGGIDGTITTFAIVSGVTGAGLAYGVILILGIANLLADAFSMAVGNYSATKSDLEKLSYLISVEEEHVAKYPDGEKEELRQILQDYGYKSDALQEATQVIKQSPELWIDLMLQKEYGISSLRPEPTSAAVSTFIAFVLCGSVPLLPFLFQLENAITISALATMLTFFLVGAVRTIWTRRQWWLSGGETLLIGSSAASIAYLVGYVLSRIIE